MKIPISLSILVSFLMTGIVGPMPSYAQNYVLPAPGVMVHLSPPMDPPVLKGIKVHPDNPFRFEFILDKGESELSNDQLKDESTKLIKYFLASLTIPEKDLWVNLSPYEKDRIIPPSFGLTEMGRDLLAEDYMLKQITASLIYPEDAIGKRFWKRIYEESAKKFGTTNMPVNTFNKVWIIPEKAVVYENAKAGTAYVVESKLKVMLEQDYLALAKNSGQPGDMFKSELQRTCPQAGCQATEPLNVKAPQVNPVTPNKDINALGSQIIREIVIPELTREVNENKNFVRLRQVYNSLILAAWYKKKIKDSILEQVYADKNKVAGVNINDPQEKQKIYERYLQAFKKGAYNYIKEEKIPYSFDSNRGDQTIVRKYFSGGIAWDETNLDPVLSITDRVDPAMLESGLGGNFGGEVIEDVQITSLTAQASDAAMHVMHIPIISRLIHPKNPQEINEVQMSGGATQLTRAAVSHFRYDLFPTTYENKDGFLVRAKSGGGWLIENTSFAEMDRVLGILHRIEQQDKERKDKSEPILYIELGFGNGRALIELQEILQKREQEGRGIPNVQLYGFANERYPRWRRAPKGLHFILDTADHLKDYFKPGSVALMSSYYGFEHLFEDPRGEEFVLSVFRELKSLLKENGEIVFAAMNDKMRYEVRNILPLVPIKGNYSDRNGNSIRPSVFHLNPKGDSAMGGTLEIVKKLPLVNKLADRLLRSSPVHTYPLDGQTVFINGEKLGLGDNNIVYPATTEDGKKVAVRIPIGKNRSLARRAEAIKGLEEFKGPEYLGQVKVKVWGQERTGIAEELLPGIDVEKYFEIKEKPFPITENHIVSLKFLEEKIREGTMFEDFGLHNLRLTRDEVRPFDMRVIKNASGYFDNVNRIQDLKSIAKLIQRFEVVMKEQGDLGMKTTEMAPSSLNKNGGIDLTSAQSLTVQNNTSGIKFHLDPLMLKQLQNTPGFVPVIINVRPMTDLRLFLGLAETNQSDFKESITS